MMTAAVVRAPAIATPKASQIARYWGPCSAVDRCLSRAWTAVGAGSAVNGSVSHREGRGVGWPTGIEPVTFGATIRWN